MIHWLKKQKKHQLQTNWFTTYCGKNKLITNKKGMTNTSSSIDCQECLKEKVIALNDEIANKAALVEILVKKIL